METVQVAQKQAADALKKYATIEETLRYKLQKASVCESRLSSQLAKVASDSQLDRERNSMLAEDASASYQRLVHKLKVQDENSEAAIQKERLRQ